MLARITEGGMPAAEEADGESPAIEVFVDLHLSLIRDGVSLIIFPQYNVPKILDPCQANISHLNRVT